MREQHVGALFQRGGLVGTLVRLWGVSMAVERRAKRTVEKIAFFCAVGLTLVVKGSLSTAGGP